MERYCTELFETLGGTQQSFIREGSDPRSDPLSFYILFLTKKVPLSYTFYTPFYWQIVPRFTYLLKKFAFLNFCTCTIFKIWINYRPERFLSLSFFLILFHSDKRHKSISQAFWVLLQTEIRDFSTLTYTWMKSEKRYLFRAEPSRI